MDKSKLPYNFSINQYKLLNSDLHHMNHNELIKHYLIYGINEKRKYIIEVSQNLDKLPNNFNLYIYKLLNTDLNNMNNDELIEHYLNNGVNEKRNYLIELPDSTLINKLPYDFNIDEYKLLNNDLIELNNIELINHYLIYGINELRLYKIIIPIDFNLDIYRKIYNDIENLDDKDLKIHYFKYGFIERRLYNMPYNFEKNDYNLEKINDYIENENNENIKNKINYIDGIVWINSIKSIYKKNKFKNILNNINIPNIRINAINPNNFDYYKFLKINFEVKDLNKYKFSRILSNIKSIYKLKNINGSYFMICEDNISFNNLKYFKKNLKDIIIESPIFDILILNKSINDTFINNIYINKEFIDDYVKLSNLNCNIFNTYSYIISRSGIEKISKLVDYNIDTFIFHEEFSDIFIYKYLDTYVYKYNFIDINILDTILNNKYIHIYNSIEELNLIKENKDLL